MVGGLQMRCGAEDGVEVHGDEMSMHCWNVAQKDSALRYSLNTRMTHEAAYNRYRHELEKIGIESAAAFRRIIHSAQSLECHHRRKQLDEQRIKRRNLP